MLEDKCEERIFCDLDNDRAELQIRKFDDDGLTIALNFDVGYKNCLALIDGKENEVRMTEEDIEDIVDALIRTGWWTIPDELIKASKKAKKAMKGEKKNG